MKSVKELILEGKAASFSTPAIPSDRKVKAPPIILFRRTAIRVFPDNHIVALYYSPQLDKYVSIPFGPEGKAQTIDITEEAWKDIGRKDSKTWEKVEKKKNTESNDPSKDQPDDISLDWKKVKRKKKDLNEIGPIIPALVAGARLAANSLKFSRMYNAARRFLRSRNLPSNSNSSDAESLYKNNKEHQFDSEIGKRTISNPINVWTDPGKVNNPVTNFRQKQNQNYIWNSQARIDESINTLYRIKDNNKSEIMNESVRITPRIAKKLINLHESLNIENKKIFEKMISENTESLRKLINFSLKV